MLKVVKCRSDRCCLERIFGILFFKESKELKTLTSLFGCIHSYQNWGYTYENYEKDCKERNIKKPIIKVWTGR